MISAQFCAFLLLAYATAACASNNLSCYQCLKETNSECVAEDLLPCPPVSDRCVTTIAKNAEKGFSIKRECGLGPCGFDDVMMNKGLGLGGCDRSRDEYFCIFCCRESGCNRSESNIIMPSTVLRVIVSLIWVLGYCCYIFV